MASRSQTPLLTASSRASSPLLPAPRSRTSSASSGSSRRSGRRRRRSHTPSNISVGSVGSDKISLMSERNAMTLRGKNQFSKITAQIKDKDRKKKKEVINLVEYVDKNRAVVSAALGAKDLSGDIKKHRRKLQTEEDADELDTPAFLLLSEQAEWAIKVPFFL